MSDYPRSRYFPLFKAIIKHVNIVSVNMNEKIPINDQASVTLQEWLVTELIVEQRDSYFNMVELSRMIGLPPSSFFRIVRQLQKAGLVEKYRIQSNKKSVVLRPTELAIQEYAKRSTEVRDDIWGEFFSRLDGFSDEEIVTLTEAFDKLNENIPSSRYTKELELIKVE